MLTNIIIWGSVFLLVVVVVIVVAAVAMPDDEGDRPVEAPPGGRDRSTEEAISQLKAIVSEVKARLEKSPIVEEVEYDTEEIMEISVDIREGFVAADPQRAADEALPALLDVTLRDIYEFIRTKFFKSKAPQLNGRLVRYIVKNEAIDFHDDTVVPAESEEGRELTAMGAVPFQAADAEEAKAALRQCKISELKEMLRDAGMKQTGKKDELIDRIVSSGAGDEIRLVSPSSLPIDEVAKEAFRLYREECARLRDELMPMKKIAEEIERECETQLRHYCG